MSTEGQQRVTLPDSIIRAIRLVAADVDTAPAVALEVAIIATYGYALFTQQDEIDPTSVAIPEDQWAEVSRILMDVRTSDVERVNLSLDWMNIGPSGYKA